MVAAVQGRRSDLYGLSMNHRTERCTDLEFMADLRECAYRSPSTTAAILNVSPSLLRRVMNSQPVSAQELATVRMAWARFQPAAVRELLRAVLDAGDEAHPDDISALMGVVMRLLKEVER